MPEGVGSDSTANGTHPNPTSTPSGGCKGQQTGLRTQAPILQFHKTGLTGKHLEQTSHSPSRW